MSSISTDNDIENWNQKDIKKHIKKVHKNLAHQHEDNMIRLFKMAKKGSSEIIKTIKEVVETCDICRKFKKTPPRPKVAMPKATTINEVVSMDLKEKTQQGKYIWYGVCEFSGYMMGEVISNKKPETIMNSFTKKWVREGPGVPRGS